ncbi:hypothetical protein WN943_001169 [Citrus x changshan-huyou]
MGKRNEEAGGGGEIGEAGRGVWNGREFRIHLQEMKFDDVQIRVTRRELTITERGSMNLITSSRLPRTASSHFSPFMQNGFLVLRFCGRSPTQSRLPEELMATTASINKEAAECMLTLGSEVSTWLEPEGGENFS